MSSGDAEHTVRAFKSIKARRSDELLSADESETADVSDDISERDSAQRSQTALATRIERGVLHHQFHASGMAPNTTQFLLNFIPDVCTFQDLSMTHEPPGPKLCSKSAFFSTPQRLATTTTH